LSISNREILTRRIRDAVDIVDVIGDYLTLQQAGANYKGLCPFHEEKTPSFNVHPAKQIFKCFGCGAGGDVFKFIQMIEKVDFLESRRMLAERTGISLDTEERSSPQGPGKSELARVNAWALKVFQKNYQVSEGEQARNYVAERGISEQMADEFGIGLAVNSYDSLIRQAQQKKIDLRLLLAAGLIKQSPRGGYYDTFRNRLMFPIKDASGRVVGFGGRTMDDNPAKYLNTPATELFDKSSNLFGIYEARKGVAEKGRVIVVEGYTDVIMAHQHGFTETVATLGTAMTDAHVRLLARQTDQAVLVFDSDNAGQQAAERGVSITLSGGLDVTLAQVPEGKDPCDFLLSKGKESFEIVLKQGLSALEFKWRRVLQDYGSHNTGAARKRAIEAYLQDLSSWIARGVIDPIQKGLLLGQLSKILSIPAEDLYRRVDRMVRRDKERLSNSSVTVGTIPKISSSPLAARMDQVALRQIVEVLLNEPGLYKRVVSVFDPAAIEDKHLSVVAQELKTMLEADEPFRMDELIGRFDEPAYGGLITDLQMRGERRGGDYKETIEAAGKCLSSYEASRETVSLADELLTEKKRDRREEDEKLLALGENIKQNAFFANKARRRIWGS
jgi:DNA primase